MNLIQSTPKKRDPESELEVALADLESETERIVAVGREIDKNQTKLAELENEKATLDNQIADMNAKVGALRDEFDSLTNEEKRLTTSIGRALIDIEAQRKQIEEKRTELEAREQATKSGELALKEDIEAENAKTESIRHDLALFEKTLKDKEQKLNLAAGRLEEYKNRLLLIGQKRNGGIEVPLQE